MKKVFTPSADAITPFPVEVEVGAQLREGWELEEFGPLYSVTLPDGATIMAEEDELSDI